MVGVLECTGSRLTLVSPSCLRGALFCFFPECPALPHLSVSVPRTPGFSQVLLAACPSVLSPPLRDCMQTLGPDRPPARSHPLIVEAHGCSPFSFPPSWVVHSTASLHVQWSLTYKRLLVMSAPEPLPKACFRGGVWSPPRTRALETVPREGPGPGAHANGAGRGLPRRPPADHLLKG